MVITGVPVLSSLVEVLAESLNPWSRSSWFQKEVNRLVRLSVSFGPPET